MRLILSLVSAMTMFRFACHWGSFTHIFAFLRLVALVMLYMPRSDSEGGVGEVAVVECEGWQVVCLLSLANSG